MKTKRWLTIFSYSINNGQITGQEEVFLTFSQKVKYLSEQNIYEARNSVKNRLIQMFECSKDKIAIVTNNIIPLDDKKKRKNQNERITLFMSLHISN
jgi:hypothetical protein